jgi:hypothetical protein
MRKKKLGLLSTLFPKFGPYVAKDLVGQARRLSHRTAEYLIGLMLLNTMDKDDDLMLGIVLPKEPSATSSDPT